MPQFRAVRRSIVGVEAVIEDQSHQKRQILFQLFIHDLGVTARICHQFYDLESGLAKLFAYLYSLGFSGDHRQIERLVCGRLQSVPMEPMGHRCKCDALKRSQELVEGVSNHLLIC